MLGCGEAPVKKRKMYRAFLRTIPTNVRARVGGYPGSDRVLLSIASPRQRMLHRMAVGKEKGQPAGQRASPLSPSDARARWW